MCGLCGAFAFHDTDAEELLRPVQRLTELIVRRGPDDVGFWSDRKRCALGFRRLSILDLSEAGHQPMTTSDGRYALVFNGEIYNFRELREELEQLGHHFRSSGDAEVLLFALREWGTDALRRLNGMFALGFYDSVDQRLLLARDHAGIKPLFFGRTSHGVVFGSQYDQLLRHPWHRERRVSSEGVGLYLRLGFLPTTWTLHTDIGQIAAGEWMSFTASGAERRGEFGKLPQMQHASLKGRAAVEEFDAAFTRAIKRQLVSDVPVGVFLSGGIDSPLVAAEAKRNAGNLRAFTIGVLGSEHDESADAQRYAREIGVNHITENITSGDALRLLDDVVDACTEPTADYSIFPTLLVSRLARRHVTVVLSGDGGDELFWGYPSRFGSTISQARYFAWPRLARYAAIARRRVLKRGSATRDVLQYDSVGRLYLRKHTLMAEADLATTFPSLPPLPPSFRMFSFEGTGAADTAQWTRWNEFYVHLSRVLAKVDRASMFNSLEVRVPLLDREVIDVAWRTDWSTCLDLDRGRGKLPLRQALARRVRHQTSAKKGFTVPMNEWLVGPLRERVHDLLLARREILGIPIALGAVAQTYAALRAGDASKAWGLWLLLSLAMWEQRHCAGPS